MEGFLYVIHVTDRTGCNILSDLAVHDFDFLTWIMQGTAPESIYVVTHAHDPIMAEIGQPDVCSVIMKYPDGSVAMLDACRESCYGYDNRVEVSPLYYGQSKFTQSLTYAKECA